MLLPEDIPLKTDVQDNSFNKFSTHKTFLQTLSVTIANGNRLIHKNAFLDAGFDKLLKQERDYNY